MEWLDSESDSETCFCKNMHYFVSYNDKAMNCARAHKNWAVHA